MIMGTNLQAVALSEQMNEKLSQICKRCELDRPILMRDKLDLIWTETSNRPDIKIIDQ